MTESEFLKEADAVLNHVEAELERWVNKGAPDMECARSGNVLEMEIIDNGSKIIINSQTAMQELWVAARTGGYHFKAQGGRWVNTRGGADFFETVSRVISEQCGVMITIAPLP